MNQQIQPSYREFFKLPALLFVALGFLAVLALPAWGNPAHVHKGVSPFEGKSQHKHSHCLLNKHDHGSLPCPHALLKFPKDKSSFFIMIECGGSRQGSLPAKTSFDHNPGMTVYSLFSAPSNNIEARASESLMRVFHLPKSLDHPPKSV